jgi:hypothetical protein
LLDIGFDPAAMGRVKRANINDPQLAPPVRDRSVFPMGGMWRLWRQSARPCRQQVYAADRYYLIGDMPRPLR